MGKVHSRDFLICFVLLRENIELIFLADSFFKSCLFVFHVQLATKDVQFLFQTSNNPRYYHSDFPHFTPIQTISLSKYLSSPFSYLFCLYLYFVKDFFFSC